MILNNFNIAVIGLQARDDRWQRCKEIFEGIGAERVTRYMTVQDHHDSRMGYMRDFLNLLNRFKGESLMFFEDDFELTPGWEEVVERACRELPDDYDILYLGCNPTSMLKKYSDTLARVYGAWLMHATLLSKDFIDHILKYYRPSKVRIIDEWYRQQAPYRNFYMTMPQVSFQRPGFSDMEGLYVNYQNMAFNNKFYKRAYENFNNVPHIPSPSVFGGRMDAS